MVSCVENRCKMVASLQPYIYLKIGGGSASCAHPAQRIHLRVYTLWKPRGYNTIKYDKIRYNTIKYGIIRYDIIRYNKI